MPLLDPNLPLSSCALSRAGARCWTAFVLVSLALATGSPARADFQGATHMMPFDEDTIAYSKAPASNAVTRLEQALTSGQAHLSRDPSLGYLPAVLNALGVSTNSQMLVFSKTSFQRERISPQTPRALYFNDEAYIGFIPGSPLLEISAVDPKLGAVFYTLDQSQIDTPKFVRTDQCLECHASTKTMGVPGHLVRSFVTDETGVVDLSSGISQINHRTPMTDRWGGWYVSGTHGAQAHRGNLIGKAAFQRQEREPNFLGNVTNLTQFFDTSRYPTGHSDIVALLVLEHQTHLHNFITRLNYAAVMALQQYGHVKYMKSASEAFLKYLLFTEEIPLSSPVKGTSAFAETFAAVGPKDKRGRSLRDLDLQTRIFKHPCSFLIYSEAFDALPEALREHLFRRLFEILTSDNPGADFARIPAETRRAIYEILLETKKGLPEYWSKPAA